MGCSRHGTQIHKRAVNTYSNLLEEEIMETIPPMETLFNKSKLQTLESIFPDIHCDILKDVLGTANYDIDAAAEMIAEMSISSLEPQVSEICSKEIANRCEKDGYKMEFEMEGYQWITTEDDWEMIETGKAPVKTFAEIIQSCKPSLALSMDAQRISIAPATIEYTRELQENKKVTDSSSFDDAWTIKSFGARKRQNMRKMRKMRKMKTKQLA
ncbi:hypothetical protein ABG067_001048 [Albugo candida]